MQEATMYGADYAPLTTTALGYIAQQEPKAGQWFTEAPDIRVENREYKVVWRSESEGVTLALYSDGVWAMDFDGPLVSFVERRAMGEAVYQERLQAIQPAGWAQARTEGRILPLARKVWVDRMTKRGILAVQAVMAVKFFQSIKRNDETVYRGGMWG